MAFQSKFESKQRSSKLLFITVFSIIGALMIFVRGARIKKFSNGKTTYMITVVDGHRNNTTYVTDSITNRNGCIEFVDEFNLSHILCSNYDITKY